MQRVAAKLVSRLDLLVVSVALGIALVPPIFLHVPYNDEWLRINYLADHSVWNWMVMHCQTWVVRPTAELIMAGTELPLTRPAMGSDFTAHAFLTRLHASYLAMAAMVMALLYMIGVAAAGGARSLAFVTLTFGLLLICVSQSSGLGYAFFWRDGYGNVVFPFLCLALGLALMTRGRLGSYFGMGMLVIAALGHEVECIFVTGFAGLQLFARGRRSRTELLLSALLLAAGGAILYAQILSPGPLLRADVLQAKSGARYNVAGMWQALELIEPKRWIATYLAGLLAIALYGERLQTLLGRACSDARRHRPYWLLLSAGALLTSFVPLASIGLKKPARTIAVTGGGYYTVAMLFFVILGAVASAPLLVGVVQPWTARYRRTVGSLVPLLLLLCVTSSNWTGYRTALLNFSTLNQEAEAYMNQLFAGGDRVRVCRPTHPFSMPVSTMTTRNAAQYFGIRKLKEVSCGP